MSQSTNLAAMPLSIAMQALQELSTFKGPDKSMRQIARAGWMRAMEAQRISPQQTQPTLENSPFTAGDIAPAAERAPVGDERAAFEAAYSEMLNDRSTPPTFAAFMRNQDGSYVLPIVERAWSMWQARAALASAPVAGEAQPTAIHPRRPSGVLSMDGASLHIQRDGSVHIIVAEDDFTQEDDRSEGPEGPQGSVHWIARLPASEVAALRDFLTGHARPSDDALWDQTLTERDEYHDMADKLANAIADHLLVEIGEHSSSNCPWMRALEAIENAAPQASTAADERDAKDAARYRQARTMPFVLDQTRIAPHRPVKFDALIDAAIAAQKGEDQGSY